jgi:uncharacterized protein YecE (DUF72 family)
MATSGRGLSTHHDPGPDTATERAAAAGDAPARGIDLRGGHRIRVGTAGWTDPTLLPAGRFYPPGVDTPEERLRYYASRFPLVEIDSSYYGLPVRRNAELWAERTPDGFTFDIKAFALMTGHPTEVARLPRALRDMLPPSVAAQRRIYPRDLPPEVYDEVWALFRDAVDPLVRAGKLGSVLLQYPQWFVPSTAARNAILEARDRLEGIPCTIEFRNRRWFDGPAADRTLAYLRQHTLPYVIVDEPQGLPNSVPPIADVTAPRLAIVRMHGRRDDMWGRRGASVADKYRYLYDRDELASWVPRVLEVAERADETHVVFNNCYANYGTTNALELSAMLAAAAGE